MPEILKRNIICMQFICNITEKLQMSNKNRWKESDYYGLQGWLLHTDFFNLLQRSKRGKQNICRLSPHTRRFWKNFTASQGRG